MAEYSSASVTISNGVEQLILTGFAAINANGSDRNSFPAVTQRTFFLASEAAAI